LIRRSLALVLALGAFRCFAADHGLQRPNWSLAVEVDGAGVNAYYPKDSSSKAQGSGVQAEARAMVTATLGNSELVGGGSFVRSLITGEHTVFEYGGRLDLGGILAFSPGLAWDPARRRTGFTVGVDVNLFDLKYDHWDSSLRTGFVSRDWGDEVLWTGFLGLGVQYDTDEFVEPFRLLDLALRLLSLVPPSHQAEDGRKP